MSIIHQPIQSATASSPINQHQPILTVKMALSTRLDIIKLLLPNSTAACAVNTIRKYRTLSEEQREISEAVLNDFVQEVKKRELDSNQKTQVCDALAHLLTLKSVESVHDELRVSLDEIRAEEEVDEQENEPAHGESERLGDYHETPDCEAALSPTPSSSGMPIPDKKRKAPKPPKEREAKKLKEDDPIQPEVAPVGTFLQSKFKKVSQPLAIECSGKCTG